MGMCHGNVPQGCVNGICHRDVPRGCVTGMCHGNVPQGCATGMCHRDGTQGYVTGMCHRDVPQGCATGTAPAIIRGQLSLPGMLTALTLCPGPGTPSLAPTQVPPQAFPSPCRPPPSSSCSQFPWAAVAVLPCRSWGWAAGTPPCSSQQGFSPGCPSSPHPHDF